ERARLDLAKARERTEIVRKTMQRATGALERQDFESAVRSANEALALDPVLTEALNLRRRAQAAIEQQRRREKERQAALAASRAIAPTTASSTPGRRGVPV